MDFTTETLTWIQCRIDAERGLSRVQLSRAVCGKLDWRSPNGRLKEMSCRVALLKLEQRGLLELGPSRARPCAGPSCRAPAAVFADAASAETRCSLAELGRVEVVRIGSSESAASARWDAMMRRYHYLGNGPLCGAQMRYLIRSQWCGEVGGLAFSAAAYAVAARDRWIGWSEDARRAHLSQVVCNSRFLILPHVHVPHLASHVLGVAARQVAEDWQERYGYEPVLLETFVDPQRFEGTCYRAANWVQVGLSSGRGRQDREHRSAVGPKRVFVLPLRKDARGILCTEPRSVEPAPPPVAVVPTGGDWARQELGGASLGDKRLGERLLTIIRDFWAKPQASIPQACGTRAKAKAAYRFFEHPDTTMDELLKPHYEATHARMRGEGLVLAVQDTTELNYATHVMTEGLGPIGTNRDGAVGLLVHDTLAVTPDGRPLGLLDVQCWARDGAQFGKRARRYDLPIEQKESYKWLRSYQAVAQAHKSCPHTTLVSVGDREADIYELFALARDTVDAPWILVRARQDRLLAEGQEHLWQTLNAQAVDFTIDVTIPRRGTRAARTATLQVRSGMFDLRPPKRKPALGAITVWAIAAQERDAPPGAEAVDWLLLTTVPLHTAEDARNALLWYSRRWGIEVYHRTLKSGCKIEERQLGAAERIEACLAIDMVVAWRIYYLTKMGRETPDVPCTTFFEDFEWKALVAFITKNVIPPPQPPSLREAVRMVGSLGGFLGRKGDGEPGTKAMWLGLQRLDDIAATHRHIVLQLAPHLLGPPVSSPPRYG